MRSYDDITVEGDLKILLWGPPGAGKTSVASTFPGVVFVDCDLGLKVLRSSRYLDIYGKPDLVGYESFDDIRDPKTGLFEKATAYWQIIEFMNSLYDDDRVKTIVIDSLSSFQALAMNLGLELSRQHKRSQTLAKAEVKGGHAIPLPTQADYGSEMSAFQQFMDQAIGFPKNMVFLAHVREESNEKGVVTKQEPLLIGSSIRSRVGYWFDEVWYLDVDNKGERRLLTNSTGRIQGLKSRALSVPDGFANPTYDSIISEVTKQTKTR